METIPNTFKKYGYDFKLLKRIGSIVMYEQSQTVSHTQRIIQYEVHNIQVAEESIFQGLLYPKRETLAKSGEFGCYGWSYDKYEKAMEKFNELVEIMKGDDNSS